MYIWYGLRNSGIVPFNVYREQVCCACHPLCAFYDNALLISPFQAARMVTVIILVPHWLIGITWIHIGISLGGIFLASSMGFFLGSHVKEVRA